MRMCRPLIDAPADQIHVFDASTHIRWATLLEIPPLKAAFSLKSRKVAPKVAQNAGQRRMCQRSPAVSAGLCLIRGERLDDGIFSQSSNWRLAALRPARSPCDQSPRCLR